MRWSEGEILKFSYLFEIIDAHTLKRKKKENVEEKSGKV